MKHFEEGRGEGKMTSNVENFSCFIIFWDIVKTYIGEIVNYLIIWQSNRIIFYFILHFIFIFTYNYRIIFQIVSDSTE